MTSKNCFCRLVMGCTTVLFLAACGGDGGGGGGGGGGDATTITKEATLTLGQEVPPAIPPQLPANPIEGTMTVTLTTASNAISGTLTLTGDFPRVTAAHIHDGDVGVAGGVVIGLLGTGNTLSIPPGTVLTAAQAARFKAGGYYVNAHTALNAAGEIRGQLIGFADNIQPLFTANCAVSGCHVTGGSAPMSLASGVSVGNLVNQPAIIPFGGVTRVIPFNSADSVLFSRISDPSASRMPPDRQLPANEQNLIKVWIDMGAKNN